MRVTDQALRVLVLAAEEAHGSGETPVTGYHLLLGLADGEGGARHVLDVSAARLRAPAPPPPGEVALAGEAVAGVEAGVAGEIDGASSPAVREIAGGSFPSAKEIADRAVSHAQASGRDYATTTDLLFAALGPDDGPAAALLRAAGVDPARIRAALTEQDHATCCAESGISKIRPILAGMGSHAARMPGRFRAAAGLLPVLLLYAVVVAVTWDSAGPETVLVIGALAWLVMGPLFQLRVRQQTRASLASTPETLIVPAGIRPLLDRLGVRDLEVRRRPGVAADRCLRLGRRAWLVISGNTEDHPEWAGFVLWHEIAHLARRDILMSQIRPAAWFSVYCAALISVDFRALAIVVVGGPLLIVAQRWWSELACDRLAVRFAGTAALHGWVADQREIQRIARRQGVQERWSWLTHPPLALRTALHPHSPAADPVASPA
ncbi:Clp amino terminal domain-containing protein, pathogenicity island component [Actinoplanes regularis]|uniref:Clp amino terminal domain-containing protein, pathogenicity island component n=2 Tax=Actinoplanes regularis TaxID=52697 RepID=A0A239CY56_9ACTN|nr:hypothetical protein Are01nite_49880 [Actinoplanes regularis]SNS24977.1 Clp amino terminal domain-containing protein, pathogenicity island component [Actinoplanes regularis]